MNVEYQIQESSNYGPRLNTWFGGVIKNTDEVIEIRAVNIEALNPTNIIDPAKEIPGFLFTFMPSTNYREIYELLAENIGKSISFMFKETSQPSVVDLHMNIRDENEVVSYSCPNFQV